MNSDLSERFWSKVTGGSVDECWTWQRSLNPEGYGRFCYGGTKWMVAHRWSYEQLRTEIPRGLVLDHLCRNHACVNPWHLEPVTKRVNALRGRLWEREKEFCPQLHPYSEINTYITPDGHRECRTCRREATRKYRQKERVPALAS